MLTVNSLLKDLQPHIFKTNRHLPDGSQTGALHHNGPRNFTGPPRALYGLIANLRKIRAPNGSGQSKVKFSKRKPVFSMRFLVIGVPFHNQYLQDAADKLISQDLDGEELWTAEGLRIPVYHTENGG
jgi:fatty acid synthase subunit alpha, fungi type